MILSITRTKAPRNGVKLYAVVQRTSDAVRRNVVYIRSKNFRGFLCDCPDFMFNKIGKNRNCSHQKEVRKQFGRFGTKVPLT